MARRNGIEEALVVVLIEAGLTYSIDRTRGHPVIRFQVNGKKLQYFYPGTPTCPRSQANNVACLRRLIRQAQNESVRTVSTSAR